MRMLCALTALVAVTLPGPLRGQTPDARAAVPIFDGRTLNGWEGNTSLFRVQEGAIVGGSLDRRIARNEFLCTTATYRDFELRLAFKLVGEGANAGVQFRTARIPNDNEVIGYQADMGDGYWGSLYDESRRRKTLQAPGAATLKGLVKPNDWNTYVIRADGSHIQLWLNDVKTVDYTERDRGIAADGVVCVQIHAGPPSEAWYKDITMQRLP